MMWQQPLTQSNGKRSPRRLRGLHGQSLVEFALILPILLVLVLGLIDGARAILLYNTVSNAAREGARFGIILSDPAWGDTSFTADCNRDGTYREDTSVTISTCMGAGYKETIVHQVMARSAALNPAHTEIVIAREDVANRSGWPGFVRVTVNYKFVPVVLDALGLSGPELMLVGASEMVIE